MGWYNTDIWKLQISRRTHILMDTVTDTTCILKSGNLQTRTLSIVQNKAKKKHFVDSAGLCSQVKEWVKRQLSWSWQESHFKTLIHKFRIVNDTKHGVPCWDNYWTVPIPVYENLWACDSKYGRKKIKEINYDKKYWNHDFIYVLKQEPRAQ